MIGKENIGGKDALIEAAKEVASSANSSGIFFIRLYFRPIICISCHIHLQSPVICYFIPGNNVTEAERSRASRCGDIGK